MVDMGFPKRIRLAPDAYANREHTFHVVIRAMPGTAPFRGRIGAEVWDVVRSEFDRPAVAIITACLMPDHLHALVRPRERTIVAWVNGFKSFTTYLARTNGHSRVLWQPSFYDRNQRNIEEFEATLAYIIANPVAAGLVSKPSDWDWLHYTTLPAEE